MSKRQERFKAMVKESREAQAKGYRIVTLKRGRRILQLLDREERSTVL